MAGTLEDIEKLEKYFKEEKEPLLQDDDECTSVTLSSPMVKNIIQQSQELLHLQSSKAKRVQIQD